LTKPIRNNASREEDGSGQDELVNWLGRDLRRASNAVMHHFSLEFGQYNIRPALYSTMSLIERHPGSSGTRLSELLAVPRANMVLIVRELEKRGLISRSSMEGNRRAHAFHLTDTGQKLIAQLHEAHRRHEEFISSKISDAERAFMMVILKRLWMSK